MHLRQSPDPGSHLTRQRGDLLPVELTVSPALPGDAWLRTNLGRASVRRAEIVRQGRENQPILARDWHDLPMAQVVPGRYRIHVPLLEVGTFGAKALFIPHGSSRLPHWADGDNTLIKVEPADYAAGCSIYTAFVRLFGPDSARLAAHTASAAALDAAGFTAIPPSGTFRELARRLDTIIGQMGFRIIQLLPIHPTPTTYARMGRFGSPFAALDYMDVDPALAEFDRQTTPLDQFRELADAIHARDARLFLDIPVNHTGWASWLQIHHPHWFARNADRTFQSPGAWGVTWEDLSRLDYRHRDLWEYMAQVFLHWCRQGADGFRCDAGYMVPYAAWEYMTARVRDEFPDTVFLLEGLGGKLEVVESLLAGAQLDWAYSELFQQDTREAAAGCLEYAIRVGDTKGLLVHFAETHDNLRLAARSRNHARARTALAALCAQHGAFGITCGVEWFATERIDVHGCPSLNWGDPENLLAHLARLNAVLRAHPAFHAGAALRPIPAQAQATLVLRRAAPGAAPLLVLINLSDSHPDRVSWRTADGPGDAPLLDLLSGRPAAVARDGDRQHCALRPAEALCLTAEPLDLALVAEEPDAARGATPRRALAQALRAKALEVQSFFAGRVAAVAGEEDAARQAGKLARDPRAFCRDAAGGGHAPAVTWAWPRDARRVVSVPRRQVLLVRAPGRFTAELREGPTVLRRERSLPAADGTQFALFLPVDTSAGTRDCTIALEIFESGACRRSSARLLFLGSGAAATVRTSFAAGELAERDLYAVCANRRAALSQVRGRWGALASQYDSLLSANLHPHAPFDRRAMLTRCRAWLVYRGYSSAIDESCQRTFSREPDGTIHWTFAVPAGQGRVAPLEIALRLLPDANAVTLRFTRGLPTGEQGPDEHEAVSLIVRPDVEDRSAHEQTKAYTGPEHQWRSAVAAEADGFRFAPGRDHALRMQAVPGQFRFEPEWQYMVPHPFEADRGLEPVADLFSPGYFTLSLAAGESAELRAQVTTAAEAAAGADGAAGAAAAGAKPAFPAGSRVSLLSALRGALQDFLARRDDNLTVIAGHPWFLDWGRDTLICLRGLIAAGWLSESERILAEFASFERDGTLPNFIRGSDHSNRDTSDAPLWFFTACADYLRASRSDALLRRPCGGRTVLEVLRSIAGGYRRGTPNGIRVDPESGLVFSPSHFTWMDTNYPPGSPREGYPIEIQALWHAALTLLAQVDPGAGWEEQAAQVRDSVAALFAVPGQGYLADCLHGAPGVPARAAAADDALRPNQLLAITLGLVQDRALSGAILEACEELLVPGGIRSLADRPVRHPLPIRRNGQPLNDPCRPYWGEYRGDEDTRRKPAYHNGTAWTWLFPSYCEAQHRVYGAEAREAALDLLAGSVEILNRGCIGHLPEILDGDAPHTPRGAGAQAWGATELLRVLELLLTDG